MGLFVLRRFNGDEIFRLGEATILASRTNDGVRVSVDAETDGGAIQSTSDTAQHPTSPRAEVVFIVESLDTDQLVGQRFCVPQARTNDDDLASIYYYEHEELNDNIVDFLDRREDQFLIRWTATTRDVDFYDDSKPVTQVVIDGWFVFKDLKRWSGRRG